MISGITTTIFLQPFENAKMALMLPPEKLSSQLSSNFVRNMQIASRFIYREEGYQGFYKGMTAATAKAALGCYLYFSTLRYFNSDDCSAKENFILSFSARILSTFLTNPLNIIETRF